MGSHPNVEKVFQGPKNLSLEVDKAGFPVRLGSWAEREIGNCRQVHGDPGRAAGAEGPSVIMAGGLKADHPGTVAG